MAETVLMSSEEICRSLRRISHEIVEALPDLGSLLLVGIRTRGVPLANRISASIEELKGVKIPVGALDISLHRDDLDSVALWPLVLNIDIPVGITGREVVLVDDVLFTGRSVRAALDALIQLGRPQRVQLAVLIDRGHRELPIRPDYVAKNMPTSRNERVKVYLVETDGKDIHTNSIEGFWGQLKRSVDGTYHHVTARHLQDYVDEYSFRYNHRKDREPMFKTMLKQVVKQAS